MEAERLLAYQFPGAQLGNVPDAQFGEPLLQDRLPLREDVRLGGVDQDEPATGGPCGPPHAQESGSDSATSPRNRLRLVSVMPSRNSAENPAMTLSGRPSRRRPNGVSATCKAVSPENGAAFVTCGQQPRQQRLARGRLAGREDGELRVPVPLVPAGEQALDVGEVKLNGHGVPHKSESQRSAAAGLISPCRPARIWALFSMLTALSHG